MNTEKLIIVAAIAGAFGVKGEVKLKAFTADLKACVAYGPLRDEKGNIILTPTSSRVVKDALAVNAKEVTTREQAQALKSTKLYIYRDAMPGLDEDEFYYTDLIGLEVRNLSEESAGKVKAVHNFGAGDMLEISEQGQKDRYLLFTREAVPRIDIGQGFIVIDPPQTVEGDEQRDQPLGSPDKSG